MAPGLPCSFGVVLLEIVTGVLAKARGHMQKALVPDNCPPDVWQLIQSCIDTQPAARPTAKVRHVCLSLTSEDDMMAIAELPYSIR